MDVKECQEAKNRLISEKATLEAQIKNIDDTVNKVAEELGVEPTVEALTAKSKELQEAHSKLQQELTKSLEEYNSLISE